jgi:hypothetical protein
MRPCETYRNRAITERCAGSPSGTTDRPSGETKAGLWAVWATIRLWSLTLRLWWDGLTNRATQAVPREYVFESSSSLAHLGNSPEG